jgi:antirestriction protein ArdC
MKDQLTSSELLIEAVRQPGRIMQAYTAFYGQYSIGNCLLALSQCLQRKLAPGPLATFMRWKALGRHVKKDEKALTLCMPVSAKTKIVNPKTRQEEERVRTYFVHRTNWFVLAQTEGGEFHLSIPGFDIEKALQVLDVKRVEFDLMNGNVQGFARDRSVAINPVAQLPSKTTFHEIAHILLGHTSEETLVDEESTPRNIREVEAEGVALICLEALGIEGAEFCRGYLKHWLGDRQEIPAISCQKILTAASLIIKAGQVELTDTANG